MFFKTKITDIICQALILGCLSLFVYTPAFAQTEEPPQEPEESAPLPKDVTDGEVDGLVISANDEFNVLNVSGTGIAKNTTVNSGGAVNVGNGGQADKTEANTGGDVNVTAGGTVSNTTLNGGNLTVQDADATANNTTVNNGIMRVENQATADTIAINGGSVTITSGANITNATLKGTDNNNQAILQIDNGGSASSTTVDAYGNVIVSNDGNAENTTVKANGTLTATASGATVTNANIESGGKFDFSTDATVSGLNINGEASSAAIADKTASGFVLSEGHTLTAANGGTITSSGVLGGTAVVAGGGTITDTTIGEGGTLVAKEEGAIVGANVSISEGGKFDISTNANIEGLDFNGNKITINNKYVEGATLTSGGKLTIEESGISNSVVVNSDGVLQVNGGIADNTTVKENGTMNINGGSVTNLFINGGAVSAFDGTISVGTIEESGGTLNLSGTASSTDVSVNGGTMMVWTNTATANNTTVNKNGTLSVITGTINNTTINNDGSLKLGPLTNLDGFLSIDAGADVSFTIGGNITTITGADSTLDKLILNKGVAAGLGSDLRTDGNDKTLELQNGTFTISDDSSKGIKADGWNNLNVSNSTIRLESNLTMGGTEQKLTVANGSTLDVSGTLGNVLNVTLTGNLVNSGTIDFIGQGNTAGDTLTVTGDFTGDFNGVTGSIIKLNVSPKEGISDKLVVNGKVSGNTGVFLQSLSPTLPLGSILFAETSSSDSAADAFSIWRVEGSPFNWDILFENNKWYAYVTDGDSPTLVPEIVAYYGLIDNTFMQTASLGASLRNNIALSELSKVPCKVPNNLKYTNRICRSNRPVFTGWVAPVYSTATVEAPYNYKASVSGLDGGLDLISDGYAKFGLLASYRQGVYKFEESGETYTLKKETDAETKLNSYLGGAYIRVDGTSWSVLAAAYGGILDADISTSDGVESSSSGTTFGATLDVTYIWQNINGIRIQPGVRIGYTSVKMGEIEDNAGKKQEFDNASRIEAEAGIRLAKVWDFNTARAEIFIKPSVVQTINNSGTFELVEERELDNTEDRTLAKMEAGMSFDMTGNWSASLAGSYSFGSDYESASAGLSLIYNF